MSASLGTEEDSVLPGFHLKPGFSYTGRKRLKPDTVFSAFTSPPASRLEGSQLPLLSGCFSTQVNCWSVPIRQARFPLPEQARNTSVEPLLHEPE
jgi:hypothetical protein